MLSYADLEYGGITERMATLEKRFATR
jgi:hypothetical protein